MPPSCAEPVTSLSHGVTAGYPGTVRRKLAIVDDSRLRCDCLKLALDHQPKRWRITDVAAAAELAALQAALPNLAEQRRPFDQPVVGVPAT